MATSLGAPPVFGARAELKNPGSPSDGDGSAMSAESAEFLLLRDATFAAEGSDAVRGSRSRAKLAAYSQICASSSNSGRGVTAPHGGDGSRPDARWCAWRVRPRPKNDRGCRVHVLTHAPAGASFAGKRARRSADRKSNWRRERSRSGPRASARLHGHVPKGRPSEWLSRSGPEPSPQAVCGLIALGCEL